MKTRTYKIEKKGRPDHDFCITETTDTGTRVVKGNRGKGLSLKEARYFLAKFQEEKKKKESSKGV